MPFEKNIANMGHTYLISLSVSCDYHNTSEGQSAKSTNLVKESTYMVYAANILEEETVQSLTE